MNVQECVEKSLHITTEYYANNIEPFFGYMAEDVIWHGPAIGQHIIGRKKMLEAWAQSSNPLTFSLGDIEAQYVQLSPTSCEVMLMFVVTTHYPNGDNVPLLQRIQLSWSEVMVVDENKRKERVLRIRFIHISNPVEQHSADTIYPEHYNEIYKQAKQTMQDPRISLRGTDSAFYVVAVSSVIWVQTTPDQHCLIHLRGRTLKVKGPLSEIEDQTKGLLVRIHASYLVNPRDVTSIWRFKLSLSDGTTLPIPEKKYTAVKKTLTDYKPSNPLETIVR